MVCTQHCSDLLFSMLAKYPSCCLWRVLFHSYPNGHLLDTPRALPYPPPPGGRALFGRGFPHSDKSHHLVLLIKDSLYIDKGFFLKKRLYRGLSNDLVQVSFLPRRLLTEAMSAVEGMCRKIRFVPESSRTLIEILMSANFLRDLLNGTRTSRRILWAEPQTSGSGVPVRYTNLQSNVGPEFVTDFRRRFPFAFFPFSPNDDLGSFCDVHAHALLWLSSAWCQDRRAQSNRSSKTVSWFVLPIRTLTNEIIRGRSQRIVARSAGLVWCFLIGCRQKTDYRILRLERNFFVGTGKPPKKLKRIWNCFWKTRNSTKASVPLISRTLIVFKSRSLLWFLYLWLTCRVKKSTLRNIYTKERSLVRYRWCLF